MSQKDDILNAIAALDDRMKALERRLERIEVLIERVQIATGKTLGQRLGFEQ